jgi:hypothetical protein
MWFYKDGLLENTNGYYFGVLEQEDKFKVIRGRYKDENVGIINEHDSIGDAIIYIGKIVAALKDQVIVLDEI